MALLILLVASMILVVELIDDMSSDVGSANGEVKGAYIGTLRE